MNRPLSAGLHRDHRSLALNSTGCFYCIDLSVAVSGSSCWHRQIFPFESWVWVWYRWVKWWHMNPLSVVI